MRVRCISCSGTGILLKYNHRDICNVCHGDGLIDDESIKDDIIQRMAGYISTLDVDEDVCKKETCRLIGDEVDKEECIDCIIEFFNNECKWEHDEFCVNDKSEWVADFAYPHRCGRCGYFKPE